MDSLPIEIIEIILNHLNDYDALQFAMTSKMIYTLKSRIKFIEHYPFKRILKNPGLNFKFYSHGKLDHFRPIASRIQNLLIVPDQDLGLDFSEFTNLTQLEVKFITGSIIGLNYLQLTNLSLSSLNPHREVDHLNSHFFFPSTLTHLNLYYIYNQPVDQFPRGLKHLHIEGAFNQPLDNLPPGLKNLYLRCPLNYPVDNLPSGLSKLYLHFNIDYPYNFDNLPENVELLELGKCYKTLSNLPSGLKHLTIELYNLPIFNLNRCLNLETVFISNFNIKFPFSPFSDVNGVYKPPEVSYSDAELKFPDSIYSLHLENDYGRELRCPLNLHNLYLGFKFNQPIIFNPNLKILKVSFHFKQQLIGLPEGLTELTIDSNLNQNLDIDFPKSLKYLYLKNYLRPIDNLPDGLETLSINGNNGLRIVRLPSELLNLSINGCYGFRLDNLPLKLQYLKINGKFNCPIDNLPADLKTLHLYGDFNHPLDHLPSGLTELHLHLNTIFSNNLDRLPKGLLNLEVACSTGYSHCLNRLPESLQILKLWNYNLSVFRLPSKLKELCLYDKFNLPVDDLPRTLVKLTLGNDFNQSVDHLPHGLQHLILHSKFTKPLDKLPRTLRRLNLPANYPYRITNCPEDLEKVEWLSGGIVELPMYVNL